MTFLLLPYILSAYWSSSIPLALTENATHMLVAYATTANPVTTVSLLNVPDSLPDLSDAFLAANTAAQLLALNQDIEDLPLAPSLVPATPIVEPTQTVSSVGAPIATTNGIGISVLPSLPPAPVVRTPKAVVMTTPLSSPVVSPRPLVQSTPTPVPSLVPLYIPPSPTAIPTPTMRPIVSPSPLPTVQSTVPYYPPVVAPPATITAAPLPVVTPRVVVPTPTPQVIVPNATPVAPPPAAPAATNSGLRGPIMKAVQSENLETYYLSYPKLGLSNVPVNPTDASNDELWRSTLIKGVGQLLYPPDSGHKTVIFGHSSNYAYVKSLYNYVFKPLYNAKVGDTASIDYKGKRINYVVKKTEIVPATTASIVTDYGREELVLFTCWPYLTSKDRFIVYLDRV